MFQPIKPKRVTEEIVQQVKDLIAKGTLAPGKRFPPEREMAQQLGVSRPTLREAIQVLEHVGMVQSMQGNGTYVREVGERSLRDPLCSLIQDSHHGIVELAEFRTAIESWAAGMAAERIQSRDVSLLKEILGEMEEGLRTGKSIHHLDAEFHLTIARATENGIYFHVANTIFYLFAEVTRLSHQQIFKSSADQRRLLQEHREIFEAVQGGDTDGARQMMHRHLTKTERWFKRWDRMRTKTRSAGDERGQVV